jgi:hypothetical protein
MVDPCWRLDSLHVNEKSCHESPMHAVNGDGDGHSLEEASQIALDCFRTL